MSETREQFRERIGAVAYEANKHKHEVENSYGEHVRYTEIPWQDLDSYIEYLVSGIGYNPGIPEQGEWKDAAEAVAAQVLRDVIAMLEDRGYEADFSSATPEGDVYHFASERGIDLSE